MSRLLDRLEKLEQRYTPVSEQRVFHVCFVAPGTGLIEAKAATCGDRRFTRSETESYSDFSNRVSKVLKAENDPASRNALLLIDEIDETH